MDIFWPIVSITTTNKQIIIFLQHQLSYNMKNLFYLVSFLTRVIIALVLLIPDSFIVNLLIDDVMDGLVEDLIISLILSFVVEFVMSESISSREFNMVSLAGNRIYVIVSIFIIKSVLIECVIVSAGIYYQPALNIYMFYQAI